MPDLICLLIGRLRVRVPEGALVEVRDNEGLPLFCIARGEAQEDGGVEESCSH